MEQKAAHTAGHPAALEVTLNTLHPTDQPPAAAPALFAVYTGPRLLGQYRAATARSAIAAARRVHERLGVSFAKGAHVWADCVAAGQKGAVAA